MNLVTSAAHVKKRNGGWGRTAFLLGQLVRRDLKARFSGSLLGASWAVLQPLSLVVCYWFVFTKMMHRSAEAGSDRYVLFLISGLVPWLGFADALMRGTPSLVENSAMVRRLTFQSEVLVVTPCITAMIFELVGIGLYMIYGIAKGIDLSLLWILPFALALQLALGVGIAWMLSVLHVLFRDVMQVLGFLLTLGLFLSPIFYRVPERYELFFQWNPMTPLLGLFRSALLGDPLPQPVWIVFLLLVVTAVFMAGYVLIRRAQPNLADLL